MGRFLALLAGRAVADQGAASDHRGAGILLGCRNGVGHALRIMAVHARDVPAGGRESQELVSRRGECGRPVDGNGVVVPKHDQTRQLQMAGEVDGLMAQSLHQTAVAGDDVSIVVHKVVAKPRRREALGDRHADRRREALSERAGGRLDPRRMPIFGMTGRRRAELAEILQIRTRHARIAEKIMQGVEQHRAVAGRQHEAIAVGPVGAARVEFHEALEQNRRDVGHTHRHAGMARLGSLDRVHRKRADRVGAIADINGRGGF